MAEKIVRERTSTVFVFAITNHDEEPAVVGDFGTLTATLIDHQSGTTVFAGRNVLNANGGLFTAPGVFEVELGPADLAPIGTGRYQERTLVISATYGAREWHLPQPFLLENVPGVPA